MKRQFLKVALALAVVSTAVFSCKKSDDNASPSSSFSYSANGTSHSASTLAQLPPDIAVTQDFSSVTIDAKNGSYFGVNVDFGGGVSTLVTGAANIVKAGSDTAVVYLTYTGTVAKGTYTIGTQTFPSVTAFYSQNSVTGDLSEADPVVAGTLEITSYDAASKKVSGTFSFTQTVKKDGTGADVTTKIENGRFDNVTLQSLSLPN